MGQALEDRDGFAKFLVNKKDRKILGCHIIVTDASILIHEVIVAMKAGNGTIDNILKSVHIHPALSEVIAKRQHIRFRKKIFVSFIVRNCLYQQISFSKEKAQNMESF